MVVRIHLESGKGTSMVESLSRVVKAEFDSMTFHQFGSEAER